MHSDRDTNCARAKRGANCLSTVSVTSPFVDGYSTCNEHEIAECPRMWSSYSVFPFTTAIACRIKAVGHDDRRALPAKMKGVCPYCAILPCDGVADHAKLPSVYIRRLVHSVNVLRNPTIPLSTRRGTEIKMTWVQCQCYTP